MKKKILIVDDDPDVVKLLEIRLQSKGYATVTASNGKQAISQAHIEKPDLIMLDVNMPPPNGFQVCRELKDDIECKEIPILLLTAKTSDSDKFWGTEAGAEAYITKPYESENLLRNVKKLLGE